MQSNDGKPSVVILISGTGSNMAKIVEMALQNEISAEISAVISNESNAPGIQYAKQQGISTQVVDHSSHETRSLFEKHLMRAIDEYQPDLVVLAGFMRILGAEFVRHYRGKMLNIHPSLLPKYQGLNTHQRALDAGDDQHGCTVHFVTEELDGGPSVIQASVSVEQGDTAETLQAKVQQKEHVIYPIAVKWFTEGRINMDGMGNVLFDGSPLPLQGVQLEP